MGNLHRVIIFKDAKDKVCNIYPFSRLDSEDPEDLWNYMGEYEVKTGGDVICVPHKGNLSKGEMFSLFDYAGNPLSVTFAESRAQWEPLYEVTQSQGDSETHPILSQDDEFADYETWNSWDGRSFNDGRAIERAKQMKFEYARSAYNLGLPEYAELS